MRYNEAIPQVTSYDSNACHAVLLLYFSYKNNNNTGSLWENVSGMEEKGYF